MGIADVAKAALEEIPLSSVLRERVSLALDHLADAERQIADLQTEKGGLQAQLQRERLDHEKTKQELKALQDSHHEEIRLVGDIEFRKGTRTGGKWAPFCPKCHLPLVFPKDSADQFWCGSCKWGSGSLSYEVREASRQLE